MGQSREVIHDAEPVSSPIPYKPTHEEYHINSGEYLKSSVYGGLDGVVNSLAVIIWGIAAGTLPK